MESQTGAGTRFHVTFPELAVPRRTAEMSKSEPKIVETSGAPVHSFSTSAVASAAVHVSAPVSTQMTTQITAQGGAAASSDARNR